MLKENSKKLIKQWLDEPSVSESEKKEIQALGEHELSQYFDDRDLKFGTAGIRTIVGVGTQRLNRHVYKQISQGYAKYLQITCPKKRIVAVITHDNRKDGDLFAYECAKVLAANNIKVYLAPENRLLATPIISYAIRQLKADGGINITASHNPKAYNGFKSYNHFGSQLTDQQAQIVIDHMPKSHEIFKVKSVDDPELITFLDEKIVAQYYEDVAKYLPLTKREVKKDLKVAFSSHHGVTSQTVLKFVHKLGYKNFVEYEPECQVTADFPDSEITNPEDPKSFAPMIKFAEANQIKHVMACDPDGDRFAMAEQQKDGKWHFLNGNEMGVLFAHYLLKHQTKKTKPRYVVSSFVSNNFIDRVVGPCVKVARCGTGFKWICEIVENMECDHDLLLAFEESIGALMFPINREKDGYQSTALSLEMIEYYKNKNLLLTDVLNSLYEKHGHWKGMTESFLIKGENWKELLQQKLALLKNYCKTEIACHHIVKIEWNKVNDCLDWILDGNNWLRFRLSGTEPKFKIYYNFFGKSQAELEKTVATVRAELVKFLNL